MTVRVGSAAWRASASRARSRLLGLELGGRRDPHDVVLENVAEAVLLQDQVERLVPGNVLELHGDRPADFRVDDDVQARQLGDRAEDVLDVRVLQVERDRLARELDLLLGESSATGRGARCVRAGQPPPGRAPPRPPRRGRRPAAACRDEPAGSGARTGASRRSGRLRRLRGGDFPRGGRRGGRDGRRARRRLDGRRHGDALRRGLGSRFGSWLGPGQPCRAGAASGFRGDG